MLPRNQLCTNHATYCMYVHDKQVAMAISSLSRRQQAKALAGAVAVAVASWVYFTNVWRGVVLSGAGDAQAVSFLV